MPKIFALILIVLTFTTTEFQIQSAIIPIPFTILAEVNLKVLSISADASNYANTVNVNITFQATENGHISWGNCSTGYVNGTILLTKPLYELEGPRINEYPISKGMSYIMKTYASW
jgi:hypothetical protein